LFLSKIIIHSVNSQNRWEVFLASCTSSDSKGQSDVKVPDAVKSAFNAAKPDVKKVEWEQEGDLFAVTFKEKGKESEITYDTQGNVISREWEISKKELPAGVLDYIKSNYEGYAIEDAEKGEGPDGIFYEVEVGHKEKEIDLVFDGNGNFKEEEISDEDIEHEGCKKDGNDENEKEIKPEELPQAVKDDIMKRYTDAKMLEADEITDEDGNITYDVEVETGGKIIEVMYEKDGKYIGMEEDDEDEENNVGEEGEDAN